jgi:hypothetical protein
MNPIKSIIVLFASVLVTAAAGWPGRVFAPYMYIGAGDHFQLTHCDDACGQKFYTIAFIIAGPDGKLPAWDGRWPMEGNLYADQINAIRSRGGDVIVSFGGEAGTEIAIAETNLVTLEANYQSVIDRYKLTWLDFDIAMRWIMRMPMPAGTPPWLICKRKIRDSSFPTHCLLTRMASHKNHKASCLMP